MTARRKDVLVFGALLTIAAGLQQVRAADADYDWEFNVLLNDKEIGYHRFNVVDDGRRQLLETEASFDVKILFINAFRYRHRNTERWENDCLVSIDAMTDNNGDALEVRGASSDGGFDLTSQRGTERLDGCVQTFAYWNPSILDSRRLLNSQTGEYEDITVTLEGDDVVDVGDETVAAKRYRLTAKGGDIRLWYSSDDSRWLALEAPAKGGRTIRYEPVSVPAPDPRQPLYASRS